MNGSSSSAHTARGATLVELVVTAAVMAIAAGVLIPSLSFGTSNKLAVAAEGVGNALRYARSEAMRTGGSVLVDAESSPGRLLLWAKNCATGGTPIPVVDPQTLRAYAVDVTDGSVSTGVVLTASFFAGGSPWQGVVFDATGAAVQACSVASRTNRGTPEAGSGVLLAIGGQQQTITLDAATGRVSGF